MYKQAHVCCVDYTSLLTPFIDIKFIHSQLHHWRFPFTMARTCQTPRRTCNTLYHSIRIVDVDGRVRYVPIPLGTREIDWCCKDIFEYCRFFFVRSADNVSVLKCNRCSRRITRKFGWRLLRNHLVDCVGTDFREQFKEQKKQHDEKTLKPQGKGLEWLLLIRYIVLCTALYVLYFSCLPLRDAICMSLGNNTIYS